ncbi:MAG: hypothetical protein VYD50_03015 [Candidatus Thermoplasmatota archaeon]|nr:hypothetical protein [Candidatus Thermoplasmatota archaeon]
MASERSSIRVVLQGRISIRPSVRVGEKGARGAWAGKVSPRGPEDGVIGGGVLGREGVDLPTPAFFIESPMQRT